MAKKEVKTDLWVAAQLDECKIRFDAQGSNVKEINEALKTASKRGTGNAGYPEYTAVIGDFVLVIEDKADMDKQIKLPDSGMSSRLCGWMTARVTSSCPTSNRSFRFPSRTSASITPGTFWRRQPTSRRPRSRF